MLKRGLALCPELAPPELRASRTPTIEDILPIVKEEACGLRPMRKDGVRIELAYLSACNGRKIPVVYNYGKVDSCEFLQNPFLIFCPKGMEVQDIAHLLVQRTLLLVC